MECPCFYYDEEDEPGTCACGHDLDEHDEKFNCRAGDVVVEEVKEELAVKDHLRNHLTDGHWYDDCQYCLNRRERGGTGVASREDPGTRPPTGREPTTTQTHR